MSKPAEDMQVLVVDDSSIYRKLVLAVVEQYRRRLQERTFVFNKQNVTVTASFGAAAFETRDTQDFAGWLRKASDALAAARLVGGNAIKRAG
jgi:GGDEF domain-containing protein